MNAPGAGDALIEALRDPQAYPHPVTAPVRIVETHVSWVVLTGPYAYKIKKPLKLSFLDYSTVERRAHLCEEEVRLNRRYAADLYLDAVPIVREGTRIRVGAARGEVVEHAVRMVQFDTREELDALLARGEVARDEIARLGTQLGEMHASAARPDPAPGYGSPQRVTLDNFAELEALDLTAPVPDLLQRLRDWVTDEHGRIGSIMQDRVRGDCVRECHGDLHCANVVRWHGRLTPFDGIEFDPALRYIDVANDLAFLTMDLAARGRRDLRHALLDTWAEALGDYAALPLLPYYEVYRALVRAKVAGLRTRQRPHEARRAQAEGDAVVHYLEWALQRTQRPRATLLLTCGLSGSGKTWLARRLAPELPALHVRSDVERKRLAGLAPLADSRSPPDAGLYTLEFNTRTYARLADCAEASLRGGENVIVDAAFLRLAERSRLLELARAHDARAFILHCTAPLDTLKARITARRSAGTDASEADASLLDRQPAWWEPLSAAERAIAIDVDTGQANAAEATLELLRGRLARG